jgi:hypothetical protein
LIGEGDNVVNLDGAYRAHSDTDQGTVMSTSRDPNVSKAGRKDTIRKSADAENKNPRGK